MSFLARLGQKVGEVLTDMAHHGTVYNPATPYIGNVPGGCLQNGTMIHIKGTPEHHHNGFLISLQAGGAIDPRSECAFVFNPRFNENQVVRNTLQHGSWGAEERNGGFPFYKGRSCEIVILCKPHKYKVSVDNNPFIEYNHRMPKERVTHITIEQGMRIEFIRVEHGHGGGGRGQFPPPGGMYPGGMPTPAPPPPAYPGGGAGQPIYNPPVPFVTNIPGGLYPNKMIFISGVVHPNPSRFSIYLQKSHHYEPNDIGCVIDSRFQYGSDNRVIVRNSRQGGVWGAEEKHCPFFPFQPNGSFDIIVMVEHRCYKVAVNNQHLLEFAHRLHPLGRTDTLRIDGDVRLTQIRFQ